MLPRIESRFVDGLAQDLKPVAADSSNDLILMSEPQSKKTGGSAEEPISLQTIVDAHLKRLLDLRDGVVACHSGLVTTSELNWDQYRSSLPPEPRTGGAATYQAATSRAGAWLTANALKDILSLHVIYFEQIRQFIEIAEVSNMALDVGEKNAEAQRRMAAKPENLAASFKELDRILVGGFTREPELRGFEVLFAIFAAQLSGVSIPGVQGPLTVTLCSPEITGQPKAGNQLPYSVQRIQRAFSDPTATRADKELIYQIFFTAFTICRDVAEACHSTVTAGQAEAPVSTQTDQNIPAQTGAENA